MHLMKHVVIVWHLLLFPHRGITPSCGCCNNVLRGPVDGCARAFSAVHTIADCCYRYPAVFTTPSNGFVS
jgi:hypothetical protein